MSHSGQVVTRDWCIDRLWWDQELTDTRTLDTHIKRLRRKIEPDPANPRHLVTVRGVGLPLRALTPGHDIGRVPPYIERMQQRRHRPRLRAARPDAARPAP